MIYFVSDIVISSHDTELLQVIKCCDDLSFSPFVRRNAVRDFELVEFALYSLHFLDDYVGQFINCLSVSFRKLELMVALNTIA